VAAVLYGIGARLDHQPELLFRLRRVDAHDLLARAGDGLSLSKKKPAAAKVLADAALTEVFGVDLVTAGGEQAAAASASKTVQGPQRSKGAGKAKTRKLAKSIDVAVAPTASPAPASRTRRSKPPKATKATTGETERPSKAARPTMGAAARKAVAERMKRYWQERRRQARHGKS
jgi:uncharacterized Zn finger protein